MQGFRKMFWPVLAIVVALALTSAPVSGQVNSYSKDAVFSDLTPGQTLNFTCALDSIDADTSRTFNLRKYDSFNWTSFPFWVQRNLSSTAGAVTVTTRIQGSFDGATWTVCDTLGTDTTTTEGKTVLQIDLNNKKFPMYRMISRGNATNRSDCIADWVFYLYQRD